MPARRVIVRDLLVGGTQKLEPRNLQQMIGRAGRAGLHILLLIRTKARLMLCTESQFHSSEVDIIPLRVLSGSTKVHDVKPKDDFRQYFERTV